ncbi:hypothetical protein OPIT5_01230 [Opitutaceae bacterium TAV5]|nr:hypothetical protein OPIT5_01230 [Opitutaceae bacterium TAV5]
MPLLIIIAILVVWFVFKIVKIFISIVSSFLDALTSFITIHWLPLVSGLIVISILFVCISRRQEKRDREQEWNEMRKHINMMFKRWSKYWSSSCFIIDSNIWMNEDYDSFFVFLKEWCENCKHSIVLFGEQFDEISNIKKGTVYREDRNRRSRLAINRIEYFQKLSLLNITPISMDAKIGAYADPVIVKIITSEARKGNQCTFISDDKELRIRVREHLKMYAKNKWNIVEIEDTLADFELFDIAASLVPAGLATVHGSHP